jgi:hypothetical protein
MVGCRMVVNWVVGRAEGAARPPKQKEGRRTDQKKVTKGHQAQWRAEKV